ncbi:MAG TPA: hypothetical protein VGD71_37900 [Kribbella sp.]
MRVAARNNFLAVPFDAPRPSAVVAPSEECRRIHDKYFARGGFQILISTFDDLLFDRAADETAAQFIRDRITERVADPSVAALLSPTDQSPGVTLGCSGPGARRRRGRRCGPWRNDLTLRRFREPRRHGIRGTTSARGELQLSAGTLAELDALLAAVGTRPGDVERAWRVHLDDGSSTCGVTAWK